MNQLVASPGCDRRTRAGKLLLLPLILLPLILLGVAGKTHAAWSDMRILYSTGWGLGVVNPDGTGQMDFIPTNNLSYGRPDWSADGAKIVLAVLALDEWEIAVTDGAGRGFVPLTFNDAHDFEPAWSADGSRIAFISTRDGGEEVFVMDADGSNQTRLTFGGGSNRWPDWSTDGSQIVYQCENSICVMNSDGSDQAAVLPLDFPGYEPSWSPDGSRIAFNTDDAVEFTAEVYTMNPDGSDLDNLTDDPDYPDLGLAGWSGDGEKLAVTSGETLYHMNAADGSDLTEIAFVSDIQELSWQPVAVADPPPVLDYLYVTPRTAGNVDGIAATRTDILVHNTTTGKWQLFFDGSDVGLTQPLAAFAVTDNLQLLLVFKAKQTLPPFSVAPYATPYDVVRFVPESLGETTTGWFEFEIDGDDIGLTKSGERIDALDELVSSYPAQLAISTVGAASVPLPGGGKLAAQDEDLIALTVTSYGTTTHGTWAAYFDGTAVPGLAQEDVTAANVDEVSGDLYLSMPGAAMVGGVSSNANQIIKLAASGGGYTVSRFWRGGDYGFYRDIAALNMP